MHMLQEVCLVGKMLYIAQSSDSAMQVCTHTHKPRVRRSAQRSRRFFAITWDCSIWRHAWKNYTCRSSDWWIFPIRGKKWGEKKKPTWRCFAAFSLFFFFPRSNKFTQQRGTAPIGPGKEEREEGDEREGVKGGRAWRMDQGSTGSARVQKGRAFGWARELTSTSLRSSRTLTPVSQHHMSTWIHWKPSSPPFVSFLFPPLLFPLYFFFNTPLAPFSCVHTYTCAHVCLRSRLARGSRKRYVMIMRTAPPTPPEPMSTVQVVWQMVTLFVYLRILCWTTFKSDTRAYPDRRFAGLVVVVVTASLPQESLLSSVSASPT